MSDIFSAGLHLCLSLSWPACIYIIQGNSEWEFIYMIPEVYEETDKDVGFNYTAVRWQVRDQRLKIKDQKKHTSDDRNGCFDWLIREKLKSHVMNVEKRSLKHIIHVWIDFKCKKNNHVSSDDAEAEAGVLRVGAARALVHHHYRLPVRYLHPDESSRRQGGEGEEIINELSRVGVG